MDRTAMTVESNVQSRVSDLLDEPVDCYLAPIQGYEDEPLLPLIETIRPISKLFNRIEDYVFVALNNSQNPADDLTQQESATIHLYTMQFDDRPNLFQLLNQSLRNENRDVLKPWFSFIKLFLTALYKLPSQSKIVWREIKNVDLSSKYKTGTKFVWWGVSSCNTNINILESNTFLDKTEERTIFSIECFNGKSIANHSYFKKAGDEVILLPGSHFEVIGQTNPAEQLHIIQLKQIEPPFLNSKSKQQLVIPNLNINQIWKQDGTTIIGSSGNGNQLNQLSCPYSMFIDDDQTIYVADTGSHRIVEWKSNAINGQIVAGENGKGNRNDQLNGPSKVIVDKENDCLIICDRGNRRVVRWPRQNGESGQTLISNIDCWDLMMDNDGYLYVSDYQKHEVRRWKMGETHRTLVAGGNGRGNRLDQLNRPYDIFIDKDHSVYVSDFENHRVMKWIKGAKEGTVVAGGHGQGNRLRQLSYPRGIIVDQLGGVYVADFENHRVMRWSKEAAKGTNVVGGNGYGLQSNQLNYPMDLSFDREKNLYVVDFFNHRVQKFDIN